MFFAASLTHSDVASRGGSGDSAVVSQTYREFSDELVIACASSRCVRDAL